MKKLISIVAVTVLYACSEDNETSSHRLSGKWNLINVTCECAPIDFEMGDHVWTFNIFSKKVTVENTIDEPLQILETGTYDLEVNSAKITILSVTYDYFFDGDKLFLADRPEVDGPLMEFVRDN